MLSVPRIHGHKRLDDDATGWWRHQRSTGQTAPTHRSVRHVFSSSASAILLSAIFSVEHSISQNY